MGRRTKRLLALILLMALVYLGVELIEDGLWLAAIFQWL